VHFSAPYNSQQNGKVERMFHTIDIIVSTIVHAFMLPAYQAEALAMCLTGGPPLLSATKLCIGFFVLCYPTLVPRLPINLQLVPHLVCFSGIPLPRRVTGASISLRGV
jgi:transposase InsO family protein